ncbi:MAG: sigma-70 family RNA polymerase sigma factor [Methanosarcinaceae archaeon]
MEPDDFNTVINELAGLNEKRWLGIRSHMGIIISGWARSERIETGWIASEEGIEDIDYIIGRVYSRFRHEVLSGNLKVDKYHEYKEVILKYTNEIITDQFKRFYNMIAVKESIAWRRVNERLFIYTAKWLSDKRIVADIAREIFQESMLTFVEKIAAKELCFETSRDFKSYYFRILELKTFEYNRKKMQHNKRSTELVSDHLLTPFEEGKFEADDRYYSIEKVMQDSISNDERYILKHYYFHGEKLSDIAKVLRISDGNCRLKKHHALRRVADLCHKIEAVQLQSLIADNGL